MGTLIDIVKRLRYLSAPRFSSIPVAEVIAEAADEIENLRSENVQLTLRNNILTSELDYWTNR